MIDNQKKGENMEIREILHKTPSNKWFGNGIHSWLSQTDARGSVDIIYRVWRILLFCGSGKVIDVKK